MIIQVLLITKWPAAISGLRFLCSNWVVLYLFHLKSQSVQGLFLSLYIKGGLSFLPLFYLTVTFFLMVSYCLDNFVSILFCWVKYFSFLSVCCSEISKSADFLFFPTAENSTKMCAVLCDKTLQFSVRTWLCWMNPFFLIHVFAPYWCSNPDYLTRSPIQPQTLLCWTLEGLAFCPTVVHWSSGLW